MTANCTYIDGIGSSQAIDTAGEVVDIAGLDCSMLVGAAFNWEHKSDTPAQIVGKVLEIKKIFSDKDCETDRQKYYWSKCQIPFLYVLGRLMDDKKDSAKEAAALFLDDAQNPNEPKMVGFSVEGAKIDKKGMVITRSIARKITITNLPANKTCIAEMVPSQDAAPQENNVDDLFRTESNEVEFFKPSSIQLEFLQKKETEMNKDVGTGGGAFIGSSLAMTELKKAGGWTQGAMGEKGSAVNFHHPHHGMVSVHKHPEGHFEVKHNGAIANTRGMKGSHFSSAREAGKHAGNYMNAVSQGKTVGHEMHNRPSPQMLGKAIHTAPDPSNPGVSNVGNAVREANVYKDPKSHEKIKEAFPHIAKDPKDAAKWLHQEATQRAKDIIHNDQEAQKPSIATVHKLGGKQRAMATEETKKLTASENISKSLEAGSGNVAPGQLTGGSALSSVSMGGNKNGRTKRRNSMSMFSTGMSIGSMGGFSGGFGKKEKSHWFERAEQEYNNWSKREEFRAFMQKRLPHMAMGEIDAVGKVIALQKSIKMEKALSRINPSGYQEDSHMGSAIKKTTDIMMANEKELGKALKFGSPEDQAAVAAALEERKKNPPAKLAPKTKAPALKGRVESQVSHVKPDGDKYEIIHLHSGHELHGHPKGKFKAGDKVVASPHIMGTHLLEHKK